MSNYNKNQTTDGWYTVYGSSIGKTHIENELLCQDAYFMEDLGEGWLLNIVCDGAGSAKHSELGSQLIANAVAPALFKKYIEENGLKHAGSLPSDINWCDICNHAYREMYSALVNHAIKLKLETKDLACTFILLIVSPYGLLISHVGDGRAGYRSIDGRWHPSIIPHKGEEANQTVFLTSKDWQQAEPLYMSGVTVPESRVILEKIDAFTLMSDGCENHSFLCSVMDDENQQWNDPNQPYEKFFTPLINGLKEMKESDMNLTDANEIWNKFLDKGTTGLANESDDKTMILGVCC